MLNWGYPRSQLGGGKTHCQSGLGLLRGAEVVGFQGDTEDTVGAEGRGGGEGDLSLLLELSKSPKVLEHLGDDILEIIPAPK